MFCLCTGCYPPTPPYPGRIWIPPLDPNDQDDDDRNIHPNSVPPAAGDAVWNQAQMGQAYDFDARRYPRPPEGQAGQNWRRVWSYGASLLHRDSAIGLHDLSIDLRRLIAQCLCDNPHYRPRLRQLNRIIVQHMTQNRWRHEESNNTAPRSRNLGDREMQRWVGYVFDRPPEYWHKD